MAMVGAGVGGAPGVVAPFFYSITEKWMQCFMAPHTHTHPHTQTQKKKKKEVRPLQMSDRRLSAPELLLDYLAERKRQAEWGACPSSPGEMGAAEGHSLAE